MAFPAFAQPSDNVEVSFPPPKKRNRTSTVGEIFPLALLDFLTGGLVVQPYEHLVKRAFGKHDAASHGWFSIVNIPDHLGPWT
jgi:hypothetical protein